MTDIIDFLVKIFLLIVFAGGLWLIFGDPVSNMIRDVVRKEKVLRKARSANKKAPNKLILHLSRILGIVLKKNINHEPYIFLAITALIFASSFLLMARLESVIKSLLFSATLAFLPYLFILARLRIIRIDGSYEGVALVTGIINNYKQNSFNIIEAVDKTACSDNVGFFSKNNLLRLSLILKSYRTEEELDEAIRTFVFAYGTEWSILLGMNIKIAAFDGTNICTSLEDILTELKSVGETLEANKRYNNESFSMIKFLLIPMYLLTVYLSVSVFGFSIRKFINYQFFTSLGLNFGILAFSSIAVCFIIYSLVKRPKFDF